MTLIKVNLECHKTPKGFSIKVPGGASKVEFSWVSFNLNIFGRVFGYRICNHRNNYFYTYKVSNGS